MRESFIMKIHYGAALGAVALVMVHIWFRIRQDYYGSLLYQNVASEYHLLSYGLLLESILILLFVHGFNGLRGILLELRQGFYFEKLVNYGSIAGMVIMIAYGSRIILIMSLGL